MTPHISNLYVDLAGNVPSIVLPSRVQTYQSDLLLCQTDDKDHGYSFKPKNEWNRQPCQSAFIKKRPIHDNFIYVQSQAKLFPQSKTPLLLKLDVEKALDTVSWEFLEVLAARGFTLRRRNIIFVLLSFAQHSSWYWSMVAWQKQFITSAVRDREILSRSCSVILSWILWLKLLMTLTDWGLSPNRPATNG
jgi:hypothetical protein